MIKKVLIFLCIFVAATLFLYRATLVRLYQGYKLQQVSKKRADLYKLDENLFIQDITQKIIDDKTVPFHLKQPLSDGIRRIVIFKYPSDSEYVGGYLSYIPRGSHPVMIFLRGGNEYFGIMRPNNPFSFLKGYNVVGTLYRGNIYGGVDEMGGKDVHDVENLIKYFPRLENFTGIKLRESFGMIGVSRGAMEMFASLSCSEYVKNRVDHAISISGNVDLFESMKRRPEMRFLFNSKFKESKEKNLEDWVRHRDPVCNVHNLLKSLKVLLVYGRLDNRVFLEEQENLKRALEQEGIKVHLEIIPDADHSMEDHFVELENLILKFMKQ